MKKWKVKLRHKACAWKFNYSSCDPLGLNDYAFVVSQWKDVTCKKCLKHKRKGKR